MIQPTEIEMPTAPGKPEPMAEIYDHETGDEITVGLQGCSVCDEALIAARNISRDRGEPVLLVDDDGEWIVHPPGDCEKHT